MGSVVFSAAKKNPGFLVWKYVVNVTSVGRRHARWTVDHLWLELPSPQWKPHLDLWTKIYGCWTKNRGILPPKWMVKIMENPIKIDDFGVPLFLETPI